MIKFENTVTPSAEQWKAIIMGTRNPLNSWNKSDTCFEEHASENWPHDTITTMNELGPNDYDLMKRLRNAGTDHRKFMRMITVYVDITAPLYWWKEFDTYKVGTVANSCSTMHKIHAKEFTLEDFSCEHLRPVALVNLASTISVLNRYRKMYLNGGEDLTEDGVVAAVNETFSDNSVITFPPKDKEIWWQMIQLLPSSYNQKRTVMLNYEVLANMYRSRKTHKLDEWRELCSWIETLPYHELITGDFNKEETK